jgi:hypothetical protein
LEQAAGSAGRSISEEVVYRLDRSFEQQSLLKQTLGLLYGEEYARVLTKAQDAGTLKMTPSAKAAVMHRTAEILGQVADAPERERVRKTDAELKEIAMEWVRSSGGKIIKARSEE